MTRISLPNLKTLPQTCGSRIEFASCPAPLLEPRCPRSWQARPLHASDDPGRPGIQFTSKELDLWTYANGIMLDFSRPGKPADDAYVCFNATVGLECPGQHWLLDLATPAKRLKNWRAEHNEVRPHSAIDDRTPMSPIHQLRQYAEAPLGFSAEPV
jgi:transposase InsO family protein